MEMILELYLEATIVAVRVYTERVVQMLGELLSTIQLLLCAPPGQTKMPCDNIC